MASELNTIEAEREQALVLRAIDGDADAFGVLYSSHLDAIYRYVYFRVADAQLAEDLTEEVFVRAWTAMPKYEPHGYRFKSWLYRIARNLIIDHYRSNSNRPSEDAAALENVADPESALEDQVADKQVMATLARAIQKLGDDEQHVIILRFVEGLSHKQVGEAIGKSAGASRVIQHRALEALAGILEANG